MSKPAIRVEDLSKHYRLGEHQRGYRTLRETIADAVKAPFRRAGGRSSGGGGPKSQDFWALRDVSLEVQPGEVVGIVGRNGAGKSTLLKILSRITEPTKGRIELRGRVGSLLEVGTGFHPELTGRENIYMNGSILGMSRREIARKFDEIVAFAEVEDFLDTPVKRYSSGMYVRLAFAVAAHLEPEILIVDEVLAVGDASFQRRCMERMTTLAKSGRTIFFVSHNLHLVPQLCGKAFLLERGRVCSNGRAEDVIRYYELSHLNIRADDLSDYHRSGTGLARFISMQLLDSRGAVVHTHVSGADLTVRMQIKATTDIRDVSVAVVLKTLRGMRIITSWTKEVNEAVHLREGTQWLACTFRNVRLRPGHQFTIQLWMEKLDVLDCIDNVQTVQVVASDNDSHFSTSSDQGIVLCDHVWTLE